MDLVSAIFTRGLSQTFAAVSALRDAFPIAGLRGGAFRDGLGFITFTTCWSAKCHSIIFAICVLICINLHICFYLFSSKQKMYLSALFKKNPHAVACDAFRNLPHSGITRFPLLGLTSVTFDTSAGLRRERQGQQQQQCD